MFPAPSSHCQKSSPEPVGMSELVVVAATTGAAAWHTGGKGGGYDPGYFTQNEPGKIPFADTLTSRHSWPHTRQDKGRFGPLGALIASFASLDSAEQTGQLKSRIPALPQP